MNMQAASEVSLTELNRMIHEEQDEMRLDFLAALLALDWTQARAHFERFRAAFSAHAKREEHEVLPRLRAYLEGRDGIPEKWDAHLQGDHVILHRSLDRIDAALSAREAVQVTHRDLARDLDVFVQLGRVLEHHHQREDRIIYPHLDAHLDREQARYIFAQLQRDRAG